jgi:adenylosuccinate lyase
MDLLLSEPKVSKVLGKKHIREIFDCNYYLKHIDEIFKRVFEGAEK